MGEGSHIDNGSAYITDDEDDSMYPEWNGIESLALNTEPADNDGHHPDDANPSNRDPDSDRTIGSDALEADHLKK